MTDPVIEYMVELGDEIAKYRGQKQREEWNVIREKLLNIKNVKEIAESLKLYELILETMDRYEEEVVSCYGDNNIIDEFRKITNEIGEIKSYIILEIVKDYVLKELEHCKCVSCAEYGSKLYNIIMGKLEEMI